jgi:hypothetical protein
MAHPSVLSKTAAMELEGAVSLLQELLPEDQYPEVHNNLHRAHHDAVGRSDESRGDVSSRVSSSPLARS